MSIFAGARRPLDLHRQYGAGALGVVAVNFQDTGAVTWSDCTTGVFEAATHGATPADTATESDDRATTGVESVVDQQRAVAGLGMGALGLATGEHAQDISQHRQDVAAQAEIESSSDAAQMEDMLKQMNNTIAFRWGEGNQTAMPYPGSGGDITVLPASYSIMVRAFLDKQQNLERMEQGKKPISRYGAPDLEDLPAISDAASAEEKGDANENFQTFFNDYKPKDMVDAMDVLQSIEGLDAVPGSGTEKMIIMVNPASIDANYILPELGMTAADYYDSQYYGEYLGSGEAGALDLADEEMVVTPEDTEETVVTPEDTEETKTEIEPEFVKSHEKYATRKVR